MKFTGILFLVIVTLLLVPTSANAQLIVKLFPVKTTGQKAVVTLALENTFKQKIQSAKAVVFLLDDRGKMLGHPVSRWVINSSGNQSGLAQGATNIYHFVITSKEVSNTTNLLAKVSFSRVVLEDGKLADATRDVQIQP